MALHKTLGAARILVAIEGMKHVNEGALVGGEIIAGNRIKLKYDSGLGGFIIQLEVVPTGTISAWPTDTPPLNHLECNGATNLLRTTFPGLFNVIGVTYGSVDGTHFTLPDLRGEFIRGFNNSGGGDPDIGSRTDRGDGTAGDNVGTKQASEFRSHSHTLDTELVDTVGGATTVAKGAGTGGNTSPAGGSVNETRPKNVYMMYIIKF